LSLPFSAACAFLSLRGRGSCATPNFIFQVQHLDSADSLLTALFLDRQACVGFTQDASDSLANVSLVYVANPHLSGPLRCAPPATHETLR
jgi:hypothetical protein